MSSFLLLGLAGTARLAAQTNAPPEITTTGPISVDEGTTWVAELTATDDHTPQGDLIWSIPADPAGGPDAASFTLSEAGTLSFAAAKDYEMPDDADEDRTYEVTVQVSDGTDTDTADLEVVLLNVIELTAIDGATSVTFMENGWGRVTSFSASSEEDRGGIEWVLGGTDADLFSIDEPPGALRFALDPVAPRIFSEPPDFEAPVDADARNDYELTLFGRAGTAVTETSTVTVTVADVNEKGELSLSSTRPSLDVALTATLIDPDGATAGTEVWKWERSTGRNSWAEISDADSASYTPAAADTNAFLRVSATYADEHGAGWTVSEVAPNVVMGPLLTALTAETGDSLANTGRGLYPAFDPQILHYGIGCSATDTMTLTVSAPADVRVAVAGVQAVRAPSTVAVQVSQDSDVEIRVTNPSGAATTYVVRCLADTFFGVETHTFPDTDPFEDLILFTRLGYLMLLDRHGVPRERRAFPGVGEFAVVRFHRVGASGAYRYGLKQERTYTILNEDFEVVQDGVKTVAPLETVNFHDFQVLADGNYLLMAWEPATRDFSGIDLPYPDGTDVSSVEVLDSAIQIVTPGGAAVFNWNSWGNVAVEDCVSHRFPVTLDTDPRMRTAHGGYAHINGINLVGDTLAASLRGCSKVLGIDVSAGATQGDVIWRMGRSNLSDAEWEARSIGPRPLDFINDPEGEFCGQHMARLLPNGNVFLFDNGVECAIDPWTFEQLGREGYDFSRAVEYALDLTNHEAVFVRDHSLRGERDHLGNITGNVDALDNGDWLVSWGRASDEEYEIPDDEVVTLVDPATGQEKLGIRLTEPPADPRDRQINAAVAPAEALAPQPPALTAEFPASEHTSLIHGGPTDAPQVVAAFSRPVVDLSASSPSLSVEGGTVASVSPHLEAGARANAYVVVLTPDGSGPVTLSLAPDQACASSGVCAADGTTLSEVPTQAVAVSALTVTFDVSSALEESGSVTIAVQTGGVALPVDETVDLEFGGTATRGIDYQADLDQIVLTAGSTAAETTLTLLDDDIDDDDETIEVTARFRNLTVAMQTIEIVDEEERDVTISESALPVPEADERSYSVVLESEPTADVQVLLRLDPATSDVSVSPPVLGFTADDWDSSRTVTVRAADDADAVADDPVSIRHEVSGGDYNSVTAGAVTVTIVEKDVSTLSVADAEVSEGAPAADLAVVFQVELSAASSDEVTVDYRTADDSGPAGAGAGSDYQAMSGTLRFPALSTTAQTIRVPVTDDAVDEAESETFTLTLSNASGASLLGGGPELTATGTILDDDEPQVGVSFGASTYEAVEGESVPVTVRLSADPERPVTIPLVTTPVGGIAEHDYTGVPESVAFGSGQTVREFTFTATDDVADDDGEAVVLRFGSMPPRVSGRGQTTLAIRDNDGGGGAVGPPPGDEDDDAGDTGGGGTGGGGTGGGDTGGDGTGGGGTGGPPPQAAISVDAECDESLCHALTGVSVRFEDVSTGSVRFRQWHFGDGRVKQGRVQPHAWSEPGFYQVTLWTSNGSDESTATLTFLVEAAAPAGTCVAGLHTRCLQDSRYSVTVDWWRSDGTGGTGLVVPAGTDNSGLFSFFDANNWEILVKVLDGCSVNGQVWVYAASTTDLGYAIRATDTVTGTTREYRNEPGMPAGAVTDGTAFAEGCQPR
ncbi:MAG: hypothetical protein F4210_11960 [Holophagales bacterium]|nr:hypothetical protein [Holophagales bacterium]